MGYTNRGSITDFWPDDTDTKMYIENYKANSIICLIEKAKEKWGENIDLSQLVVQAENIHTECIYYDLHDSSDYTDFIVLEYDPR